LVDEAIERMQAAFGPLEPALAYAHERRGSIHQAAGRLDEAADAYRRSIELFEAVYGPDHPDSAWPRSILGMVWYQRGDLDRAAQHIDEALAVLDAQDDASHEMSATILLNAALVARDRGEHQDAARHLERARLSFVELGGEGSGDVADTDRRLGEALSALGHDDEAVAAFRRAATVFEKLDAKDQLARVHYELGSHAAGRGRTRTAQRYLRRSIALAEAAGETEGAAEAKKLLEQLP
jgi:tetratricopeptide (TPR) repeat protein